MTPLHFTPETAMANLACFILGAVFILAAQEVIRRPCQRPPWREFYTKPTNRRVAPPSPAARRVLDRRL